MGLSQVFQANLSGANEVPAVGTAAAGNVFVGLTAATNEITVFGSFGGLGSAYTGSHIHNAAIGANGGIIQDLATDATIAPDGLSGNYDALSTTFTLTDPAEAALLAGELYINVHTTGNGSGEIRGQLLLPTLQLFQATLSALDSSAARIGKENPLELATAAVAVAMAVDLIKSRRLVDWLIRNPYRYG